MTHWAQISAGVCVNVVESDSRPDAGWLDVTNLAVGPGSRFDGTNWTAAPKQWPAFEWIRRLSAAERIACRKLAATDPIADDLVRLLDQAIASGTPVHADDPDIVAGLAYLSSHPAGSPVLAAGRAAKLIA